jgi:hypothetical protein
VTQRARRRERWIGVLLAATFGAICVGGVTWATALQMRSAAAAEALAAHAAEESRRRAPVLFVPLAGNVCRKRILDNLTWLIADAGYAACDEAVTWNAHYPEAGQQLLGRMEQMRASFRAADQ